LLSNNFKDVLDCKWGDSFKQVVECLLLNFVKVDKKDQFKTDIENLDAFNVKFNDNSKQILEL